MSGAGHRGPREPEGGYRSPYTAFGPPELGEAPPRVPAGDPLLTALQRAHGRRYAVAIETGIGRRYWRGALSFAPGLTLALTGDPAEAWWHSDGEVAARQANALRKLCTEAGVPHDWRVVDATGAPFQPGETLAS